MKMNDGLIPTVGSEYHDIGHAKIDGKFTCVNDSGYFLSYTIYHGY